MFLKKNFLVNKYNQQMCYKEKNVCLQKNLDCKDIIRFSICKMKGHLGRVSPSHFLQNVLIETSCVCFKKF